VSQLYTTFKAIAGFSDDDSVINALFPRLDSIDGGLKADVLHGYGGADQIDGNGGADLLDGGRGADILTGGSGADTFRYENVEDSARGSGIDTIWDFAAKKGDRIDLSAIDANSRTAKDDAFTFIARAQFDGHAGELRWDTWGDDAAKIYVDVDGDRKADMEIDSFQGAPLHEDGFIL
jgi:Ca2+-binding RTX toxin-like protein